DLAAAILPLGGAQGAWEAEGDLKTLVPDQERRPVLLALAVAGAGVLRIPLEGVEGEALGSGQVGAQVQVVAALDRRFVGRGDAGGPGQQDDDGQYRHRSCTASHDQRDMLHRACLLGSRWVRLLSSHAREGRPWISGG